MSRSYLFLQEGNLSLYFREDIFEADAIVIPLADASQIFRNFDSYHLVFEKLWENDIEIYLRFSNANKKENYRLLKDIKGEYLTGWVLPQASISKLNHLVMKVRDFELKQKLDFGTLNFILEIDDPQGILKYSKLASYERVKALMIDEESFSKKLGWENLGSEFLLQKVALYHGLSDKDLIASFNTKLDSCPKYGLRSKATQDLDQLKMINDYFTPDISLIKEAEMMIDSYENKNKGNDQEISASQIRRAQKLLLRAERLGLRKKNDLNQKQKKEAFPKKFYTIGEEIGNAVTHGIGVIFSVIYLSLLFNKSKEGKELLAFFIFGFGALSLYLCSTLYHGLPLGRPSKRLFQKFDHMTIYLLISGTYTPLLLLGVGGKLGNYLTGFLWSASGIGIFLNLFWFGRFRALHMILYLGLGWIAVFYLDPIFNSLGSLGMTLIIFGGVAYTLGVVFYGLKLFKFTHMVWHIFVLLGTLLHFLAIYFAL